MKGTWREGSLARHPERYAENASKTGISFIGAPCYRGNLEEGSSIADFEELEGKGRRVQVTDITPQCLRAPYIRNSES